YLRAHNKAPPPLNSSIPQLIAHTLPEPSTSKQLCNMSEQQELLQTVINSIANLSTQVSSLSSSVEKLTNRVDSIDKKNAPKVIDPAGTSTPITPLDIGRPSLGTPSISATAETASGVIKSKQHVTTSKIILTTYPSQNGVEPVHMNWGD